MQPLKMLLEMHKVLNEDNKDNVVSFETLLSYVASKFTFRAPINVPWMKTETLNKLDALFDLKVLQSYPWDWFGELHNKLDLQIIDNSLLVGQIYVEANTKFIETKGGDTVAPLRVLDDEAFTGRNIIEMWKRNHHAIYYGVESDITAYRIALLNMKCYDIPSSILHAPPGSDVRSFSPNWRDANSWNPTNARIRPDETDLRLRKSNGFHIVV